MVTRIPFGVTASLAAAALAMACAARTAAAVPTPPAAVAAVPAAAVQAAASQPKSGETIMNASCQGCHDLRVIQTQAKDAAGWTKTIENMLAQGAEVAKDDIPVLVNYLTLNHGPIPDGPGKEIVLNICTMCHDLRRIKTGHRSAEEWEETLGSMLNEGAPLNDAQFERVHAYLSKNFGIE